MGRQEGWIHHIVRNALSMFLTRGDLWLNWEPGYELFMNYLIDGDWAVCSGNWMWVSSSAFEKSLNSSFCLDPTVYGWRVDPNGCYVKKYPAPIVDHKAASQRNCRNMEELQKLLLARCNMEPEHVKPSDATEVKKFFNLEPREN